MALAFDQNAEWLEADGLGGFASGTVGGVRTRRYHGLLLTATTPPTGRMMLVNGFDACVETPAGQFSLTSQNYAPGLLAPSRACEIESFAYEPWPTWVYLLPDGTRIKHEILARHGSSLIAISWNLVEPGNDVGLSVRPFLSGRDYHSLHHENTAFRFEPVVDGTRLTWRPYDGVPAIISISNGNYSHEPLWYRGFQYEHDRARGQDCTEDLASPGVLRWDLSQREATWMLSAESAQVDQSSAGDSPSHRPATIRTAERKRRTALGTPLHRAADAYFVRRGSGKTILAGYPWFTDWGRDTFIAMRGLTIATGRLDDAREILLEWGRAVSQGMLPNRFPDRGERPDYNAVDASLWFAIAVHELFAALARTGADTNAAELKPLRDAVHEILEGYARGTRFGIHANADGLLAAGEPGVQLTWMDAKVGDWVVTPRIGKPVEIQALWLNALWTMRDESPRWADLFETGKRSFERRFWNQTGGYLYDVVDCDHITGKLDASFRPNQILAVGGLPISLLTGEKARAVVDAVEQRLYTPIGLRSLAPDDPRYARHYAGGPLERDGAYHQGTAWAWLLGPFVEAWVRVRGGGAEARDEARRRFLPPIHEHLSHAGLGHVSEVADAESPHTPGGCPFQAWSLGELLRLELSVLVADLPPTPRKLSTRGAGKVAKAGG